MSNISLLPAVADAADAVCPISFFDSVKDTEPYLSVDFPWGRLVGILGKHAAKQFPSKAAAPLLSPTVFDKSYRLAENVTLSGLVGVDVDHGELVDDARNKLANAGLDSIIYTTARSRAGDERFRILIPLSEPVDAITYTLAWWSIVTFFGIKPDCSKKTAESMFYLPGTYPDATNRFERTGGAIQSANWWINTYPAVLPIDPGQRQDITRDLKPWVGSTGLYDLPYVRSEWITEYLSLQKNEHYCELYKFMVRVAMSAIAQGYSISESELEGLTRDLDATDSGGPWYSQRPLAREAGNALAFALSHASPPKTTGLKIPEDALPVEPDQMLLFVEPETGVEDHGPPDDQSLAPSETLTSDPNEVPPPPARCWIDPGMVQAYEFGDRIFSSDVRSEFEFLARRCVATKKGYLVRDKNGVWEDHSRKETAHAALCQLYRGQQDGLAITVELISRFLSPTNGGQVLFNGVAVLPGMPECVSMSGGKLINTWRDMRLPGRRDCIDDAEIILRIVRENLCNLDRIGLKEMISEATGADPTLFKWVMHWLSSLYTQPGRHISTALWFLGPNQGVGKATLVAIMRSLLGEQFCTKADKSELDRGWNTFVSGALLIEADEFENGSRKDMNDFMKLMLGNPLVSIAHRNIGAFVLPNVANWLFSTNRLNPIEIERHDRRHTLVRTTDDRSRNALADSYWKLSPEARLRSLTGFAAILSSIDVDQAFTRKAFMTPHKLDLITENTGAVERWFAASDREWTVGESRYSSDLWEKFREWASSTDPHCSVKTLNVFGFKMVELEAQGYVTRDRSKKGSRYTKTQYFFDDTRAFLDSVEQTRKTVDKMIYARAVYPQAEEPWWSALEK